MGSDHNPTFASHTCEGRIDRAADGPGSSFFDIGISTQTAPRINRTKTSLRHQGAFTEEAIMPRIVPCGCACCGCGCAEHSPDYIERPCDRHAISTVTRFVAGEIATLIVLALFLGMIAVWAAVLAGNVDSL